MNTKRFTAAQVVAAVRQCWGLRYHVARRLGCHVNTVTNYAQRYPAVREAFAAERGLLVDLGERALREAIERGEAWAVRLVLLTLGKDRGYVLKTPVEQVLRRLAERQDATERRLGPAKAEGERGAGASG